MPADAEDEHLWMKATANELNNLLQVISESGQSLGSLAAQHPDAERYVSILRAAVERAIGVSRTMTERIGGFEATVVAPPAAVPERTLPSPPPAAAPSPTLSVHTPVEIHNATGPRELILIVDDEEFITLLAREVLSEEGYRVVTARNGFQALDIYRKLQEEIALVILDFTMPVMDGADVFAELQEINPRVSVVLSSGFTEHDRLRGMLARGLRGFIPKPYTQEKLLLQVRHTLDAVQAEGK
jgi:CheY-like chemotaxis protein